MLNTSVNGGGGSAALWLVD